MELSENPAAPSNCYYLVLWLLVDHGTVEVLWLLTSYETLSTTGCSRCLLLSRCLATLITCYFRSIWLCYVTAIKLTSLTWFGTVFAFGFVFCFVREKP